jgi:branched-chain amino acid transport system ATP-binding protein
LQVNVLITEQNINVALNYASLGYLLDTGRAVPSGRAAQLLTRSDVHDVYLGRQ